MKPSMRKRAFVPSLAALMAAVAPAAGAAELSAPKTTTAAPQSSGGASDNGDIVVTARRTNERAIDVPIAVSVIGGRALEEKGTYTLEDVQRQVPAFTAFNSNPRNSSVGIRGIGVSSASDGLDTSVGFYFDNVYFGRPGMSLSDLIDVERFEVLRGPQGTLFGRNTSAGVVQVITRAELHAASPGRRLAGHLCL